MEDSRMSPVNEAISFKEEGTDYPEESGWTEYFEDFLNENRENTCCSNDYGTCSLVSDAASCAVYKFSDNQVIGNSPMIGTEQGCKKKRIRKVLDDDDLEDTASSPCNSPKVSELSRLHMNRRKRDDNIGSSQGKGGKQIDERNELGLINGTELKKRGLCLVPVSMIMNYLG
ncbi:hypothetical protein NE237_001389 [Protea cynaroides]|uniref:Uncharacterized protein n=1 Tax=Protea cynaroides TaxID=273540 RepID=A0A9Q0KT06_9MAGN|nr:hypothetical protein NE237_001389 [Protea cynaroides]